MRNRTLIGLVKKLWYTALVLGLGAVTIDSTQQTAIADTPRPPWNQERAVRNVQAVIAKEAGGDFAWDKIAWQTDAAKAAALAKEENKPIFVYFFLKGDVGPTAAPC